MRTNLASLQAEIVRLQDQVRLLGTEQERLRRALRESESRYRSLAVTAERDLGERKRLEEQFIQAQKMDAVGRLAGGIAHDFSNLLTAILGFTNLLLRNRPANDPARADLEQIKKAGERGSALTRQLLAFSRKQDLQLQVLDLNGIVREMDTMLRPLIGEDLELVTVLADDLKPIKADPNHLEQVIMNLAVNARDAMRDGGKLTITTANAGWGGGPNAIMPASAGEAADAAHTYVQLSVRDTGCGMDKETQERIFEPFFTTKGRGKGTGLGLATVYGIVNQLGGQIFVASEPGQGTVFDIYLPASETGAVSAESGVRNAEAGPATVDSAAMPGAGSGTVLLTEDEVVLRNLVSVILRQHGYTVLEAHGGKEAINRAAKHKGSIDLLVTDVVMPGMNGRQLAERLAPSRPNMKVLYMSGYTDDAIVRSGISQPGVHFLAKPFTPFALLAKVREVLEAAKPD